MTKFAVDCPRDVSLAAYILDQEYFAWSKTRDSPSLVVIFTAVSRLITYCRREAVCQS
jgi:hypothetical protein